MNETELKKDDQHKTEHYDKPLRIKSGQSKLKQAFNRGMPYFIVIALCIVLYFAFLRVDSLKATADMIIEILKPIIYGFALAYLLNPIVKKVDQYFFPFLKKKIKKEKRARILSRSVGIALSLVVLFAIITTLLNMLIPELFRSVVNLAETLPSQMNAVIDDLNKLQSEPSTTGAILENVLNHASQNIQNWMQSDLLNQVNVIMSNVTTGAINVVSEVFNFFIGCIVSAYMLFSKELFASQMKKIVYALMRADHANMTLHITRKTNEIFGGFIIGKIIDSAIIGVLCFLGLSILHMPYTLLVSVIVGVTNVIPFFGPYIGAVPSAILIALNSPIMGVYFLIFILGLQQLDGNVIGPKILGDSTGLSAFWVVFSILLGGGLFGFVGMIAGVPTFAVIYYIIKMVVEQRLEKKKLPKDTQNYTEVEYLGENGELVYKEKEKKGE
nr:AI-2E family transporter [uncultured Sellimonas sp.]